MGDGTMLKYFWDEKEDVTRYTGWEECKDRYPLVQGSSAPATICRSRPLVVVQAPATDVGVGVAVQLGVGV